MSSRSSSSKQSSAVVDNVARELSIPLFEMEMRLGPDDKVDRLPRKPTEPSAFVPWRQDYLVEAFKTKEARKIDTKSKREVLASRDGNRRTGRGKGASPSEPALMEDVVNKGLKRQHSNDTGIETGTLEYECELVHSMVNSDTHLGTISMARGADHYHTLAVVALTPLGSTHDRPRHLKDSYEEKTINTAWKQKYGSNQKHTANGILLGHIIPARLKAAHPLKQVHSTLSKNGWIKMSKCQVKLEAPFVSADDAIGSSSAHPIGRAVEAETIDLEEDGESQTIWRDAVTKHVWYRCPHEMLPAAQLFGKVTFDMYISQEALQYGSSAQDDGFVDGFSVPKRELGLYSRLEDVVTETSNYKHGLIKQSDNIDTFWSRTPQRFYDGDVPESDKARFVKDNRIETALEATRPKITSPMLEPGSRIKTTLMPFQQKALAWMVSKEVNTAQDEGALLPNWTTLHTVKGDSKGGNVSNAGKRQRLSQGREKNVPKEIFFDTLTGAISLRRMTSRRSEPGGCLCDAMGLGKSLTTLSLIETHQKNATYVDQSRSAQLTATMAKGIKPFLSTSTLLVVPSSLVHQWYSEINKHLQIEADEDRGRGYVLRYKRGITIPWSVMNEREEIRGMAKSIFANDQQCAIILATYEDLRAELQTSKKSKRAISPLLEIHWWRIMLDEAQLVSTSNGSAAEMVNCLWRTNGWIITSTPFNSSIRDMHGLLTFLDSDFASKKLFEEMIAEPFLKGQVEGIEAAHSVLKRIMWRHRKEHVEVELGLPPSSNETLLLEKSGLEKTLYDREYKKMLEIVQDAVGLGRKLSKKQQDRLLSLRKLISHPQLAKALGYSANGRRRTTFANLFADLIFRNQSELHGAQMEYIVISLRIGAGKKFRKEEKDVAMWKGGSAKLAQFELKLRKAHAYAMEGVEREAVNRKEISAHKATDEASADETNDSLPSDSRLIDTMEHEEEEEMLEEATQEEVGAPANAEEIQFDTARSTLNTNMKHDEALYWLNTLLHPKDDIEIEEGVKIDPERLVNLFFERKVVEASSVDLKDARYHPVLLDAGDDEEEQQQRSASTSRRDSPTEAFLLKNRFRGNQKRRIQKVWYYHPKRKLQSWCRELTMIEEKIDRIQREGAYLDNRIHEELGVEKARLVLRQGADSLRFGSASKDGSGDTCILCLEDIELPGILPCLHTACYTCLKACVSKMAGSTGQTKCPMCRKDFSSDDIIEVLPALTRSNHIDQFGVKISGLIHHIRSQMNRDANVKIVILSAWSSYLIMLTEALNHLDEPILSVAFSGKNQSLALKQFQMNSKIRIMLVPMKMTEGAAGLTLNIASIAYLLEPSLNSALEDQALGRLNRIGQKAAKTTYFRVLVKNTIEPALVEIAERRLQMLKDKDADTRHHDSLSVDELAYIFGLNVEEEKAKKKKKLKLREIGSRSVEEDIDEELQEA